MMTGSAIRLYCKLVYPTFLLPFANRHLWENHEPPHHPLTTCFPKPTGSLQLQRLLLVTVTPSPASTGLQPPLSQPAGVDALLSHYLTHVPK